MKRKIITEKITLEYDLKKIPEDFIVTEVSHLHKLLEFNDSHKYFYYTLKKKNITTPKAIEMISKDTSIPHDYFSFAGLKDEDAVTQQHISVLFHKDLKNTTILENNVFIHLDGPIGSGEHSIEKGRLFGNIFTITLRNIKKQFIDIIKKKFEYGYQRITIINYFDQQRFGTPNSLFVTHKIGELIEKGDLKDAASLLYNDLKYRETNHEALLEDETNFLKQFNQINDEKFIYQLNKRTFAFFFSSYYSMEWNNKVTAILKTKKEVIKLYNDTNHPCNNLIIPLYQEGLELPIKLPIIDCFYKTENRSINKINTSRNVIFDVKFFLDCVTVDEINPNKNKITVSFYLPSGGYATCAIHQLLLHILK